MATKSLKWLKRLSLLLGAITMVYLFAALMGSIFPANQSWEQPDEGIELFIETNGLHTGIIMPVWTDVHDWTPLVRPEHLENPSDFGSHILISWGHEGVYRNAEKWTDLHTRDAISAVFGSDDTLIHIYHLKHPQAYPHYRRPIRVSREEYQIMAKAIESRFVLDQRYQSIPSKGYGRTDLFYQSRGHYNALYTCNSWTSDVLRQAGIRTGRWTPFQGGVMRWIPESHSD